MHVVLGKCWCWLKTGQAKECKASQPKWSEMKLQRVSHLRPHPALLPFVLLFQPSGSCRVSDFERLWGGLSHLWDGVRFFFFFSFHCHLCLCFCLSSLHLTSWHQSLVLSLLLKLWWHLIQVERHAVTDVLLLMNRGSHNTHDSSTWGRDGAQWRRGELQYILYHGWWKRHPLYLIFTQIIPRKDIISCKSIILSY